MNDKLRCEHCRKDLRLVFHHVYEVQYGGKGYDFQFLCEECHNKLHRGKAIAEHTALVIGSAAERGVNLTIRTKKRKAYGFCEIPHDPITNELANEITKQVAEVIALHVMEPFLWQAELPKHFAYVQGKLLIKPPDQMPLVF